MLLLLLLFAPGLPSARQSNGPADGCVCSRHQAGTLAKCLLSSQTPDTVYILLVSRIPFCLGHERAEKTYRFRNRTCRESLGAEHICPIPSASLFVCLSPFPSPLLFPFFSMPSLAALLSQPLVFRVTKTHRATRIVEGKDSVPYLRQANSNTLADYPKRSLIAETPPSPSMPGGRTSFSVLCVSSTLLCPLSILFIPCCSFVFCPFSCYSFLLPPPRLGPSSSGRADRRVPTFSRGCPNAEATNKKAAECHLGQ